jgi:hypothetical protein
MIRLYLTGYRVNAKNRQKWSSQAKSVCEEGVLALWKGRERSIEYLMLARAKPSCDDQHAAKVGAF